MHHPLGVLYISSFAKSENTEVLRINGDRARLEDYLPRYRGNTRL